MALTVVGHDAILDGIYAFLTADSSFNTSIGGSASVAGRLRYALARERDTLPYCVYQIIDGAPFDTFTEGGYDFLIQFSIYDDEANGPDSVAAIADNLLARIYGVTELTTLSYEPMNPEWVGSRGPFREDETWRIDTDFRFAGSKPITG